MKSSLSFLSLAFMLIISSCKKDDIQTVVLQETIYPLITLNNSGVAGTATFTENSDGSTFILIELTGSNTNEHPAYIRYNDFNMGGSAAIKLDDCTCLISETDVKKLDEGSFINYDGLLKFNGHVAILESKSNDTVVAYANIGVNAN